VDQAYIRTGALAWVCYAYALYMERTGDFERATLGLQSLLEFRELRARVLLGRYHCFI
jgi:hypothetical protein